MRFCLKLARCTQTASAGSSVPSGLVANSQIFQQYTRCLDSVGIFTLHKVGRSGKHFSLAQPLARSLKMSGEKRPGTHVARVMQASIFRTCNLFHANSVNCCRFKFLLNSRFLSKGFVFSIIWCLREMHWKFCQDQWLQKGSQLRTWSP